MRFFNIKRSSLFLSIVVLSVSAFAQPNFSYYEHDLNYFLPKTLQVGGEDVALSRNFNNEIPTPKQVLGFELGERYCEWGDVLQYVEALAAKSDRITLVEWGRTAEARRFVQLVVTSPKNHAMLDKIKAEHIALTDVSKSAALNTTEMPIVMDITCSMHGDEASGTNSSLALAYLFAASEDETILRMLDKMVLLIMPGSNPDGLHRFATWCNSSSGVLKTADINSREYKQSWPSCRSNHYGANTNRDLLMCQHEEGRVGVKHYIDWMPNVVVDLHEMSGKKWDFFHSPGHPRRIYKYVTDENQSLTGEVGAYVSKALNALGLKSFSGDKFDDYYLGKGAAYGDVQGSVCLLFEQANPTNYIRKFGSREVSFPGSIRNQMEATMAALCAGCDMRVKLLNYQRDFYIKSAASAQQSEVQGYLFHARGDRARAYRLLENLLVHDIEVYHLAKDTKVGKEQFAAEESFVIPLNQRFFYKAKALWETLAADSFEDKHFYDISTWTFPLAYNVAHAEVKSVDGLLGTPAELVFQPGAVVGGKSEKGYVVDAVSLYSHNLLNALMAKGVAVKVATKPFKMDGRTMMCGSAVVDVTNQTLSSDEIYALLNKAVKESGADVYAVSEKFSADKLALRELRMPKVALLADKGVDAGVYGEMWKLLEQQYGIAPARLPFAAITKKSLNNYNVFIAPHGSLPRGHKAYAAIREWVKEGGTLISTGPGYRMAANAGLPAIKRLPEPDNKIREERISGAIVNTTIDTQSPIGYGYTTAHLPMFRKGPAAYDESVMGGWIIPMRYTEGLHLSGYISQKNIERIASTPAAFVIKCDDGRIIHFADNPIFRSYWYGGAKLLMNAIYFGHLY